MNLLLKTLLTCNVDVIKTHCLNGQNSQTVKSHQNLLAIYFIFVHSMWVCIHFPIHTCAHTGQRCAPGYACGGPKRLTVFSSHILHLFLRCGSLHEMRAQVSAMLKADKHQQSSCLYLLGTNVPMWQVYKHCAELPSFLCGGLWWVLGFWMSQSQPN